MPQYLAIDYLNDALCRKQATFSQMHIACPPHILQSNYASQDFAYREPWLKGVCKINAKEMIEETLADLGCLTYKLSNVESLHLQFDGIQYHCSGHAVEEIVPSSNSNSDSEVYSCKPAFAECNNVTLTATNSLHNETESFSFQPVSSCFILSDEITERNGCMLSNSCPILEPLITADNLEPFIPTLFDLVEKLNVFSIPDPIDIVESTLKKINKNDKEILYDKTCKSDNTKLVCEELLLKPFSLKMYELEEIFCQSFSMPMQNINAIAAQCLVIKPWSLNDGTCTNKKCIEDLASLTNQATDCCILNKVSTHLEKEDSFQNLFTSCEILLKESMATVEETLSLQEPFIMHGCSIQEVHNKTAVIELNLLAEKINSDDFILCLSTLQQLEHQFKIEKLPGFEKYFFLDFVLPEPKLAAEVGNSSLSSVSDLTQVMSLLKVELISNANNLHLCLPWDPVSHASDEMGFMRSVLQHEKLQEQACDKLRREFSTIYSEAFESILNRSVDGYLTSDNRNVGAPKMHPDIPSVKSKAVTTLSTTSISTETNQVSMLADFGDNFAQKIDSTLKKLPEKTSDRTAQPEISYDNLDPLSNFMMLMGKQQKEILPWSTISKNASTSVSRTSISSLSTRADGKSLAVKRIRSAKVIDGTTDLIKAAQSVACNDDFPNKKVKRNASYLDETPNLLICSGIAAKSKLSKTIQVNITGATLDLACAIEKETLPVLEILKSKELLPADSTLSALSRETTRFLLKQQQKLIEGLEKNHFEPVDKTFLFHLQALHQMVSFFYLLIEVSFTSALAHLHASLQELQRGPPHAAALEHAHLFRQCVQILRSFLCKCPKQAADEHLYLMHPKISELRIRLNKWFYKHRNEESCNVLIVCITQCRYLLMKLCKELSKPDDSFKNVTIKPISVVVDVDKLTKSDILDAFEKNNVLIIGKQMIFEDFPWNVVGLVVEYEYQDKSPLKSLSAKLMIKHYSLKSVLPTVSVNMDVNVDNEKCQNLVSVSKLPIEDKMSIVLIGSEKFSALGNLMHLMETRYDMVVVERDYNQLQLAGHPDLIIDAHTCILLVDVLNLQEKGGDRVKSLLSSLMMIKRKFMSCHVLIFANSRSYMDDVYPLGGSAPLNIARFQASVKQLNNCAEEFKVVVRCCFTISSVAEVIYDLGKKSDDNKKNRSWISTETSSEELFLLRFHSINSFVAQRLLSVSTMLEILQMSQEQLYSSFFALNIPKKIARDFYLCLHEKYEVSNNSSSSIGITETEVPYSQPKVKIESHPTSSMLLVSKACTSASRTRPYNIEQLNAPDDIDVEATPSKVKINFVRPNFDLDPDFFTRGKKHPYYNQFMARNSQNNENNFLLREIQQTVQEESRFVPDALNNGRNFSAGYPHLDANPPTDIGCSGKRTGGSFAQNDVDIVMLSAQKKLLEFVRRNPDRAKHDVENADLSNFTTDGVASSNFPSCTLNSFFPGSVSSSIYQSDVPFVEPKAQRFPTYNKEQLSYPCFNTTQTEKTCLPYRKRHFDSCSSNENAFINVDDQPCCSYQPPTSRHPTPHLHRLKKEHVYQNYDSSEDICQRLRDQHDSNFSNREENLDIYRKLQVVSNYQAEPIRDLSYRRENSYVTGTSGSANIGIAQPFLQQPWSTGGCERTFHNPSNLAIMTPNAKKKVLAYEKVPGSKDGQTRLTFC